ncbi:MAG: type II toxin-antitoxin system YoeB family toxin [Syntrophorhabdus sp.]
MIHFTKEAWGHYLYWQATDRSTLKKINILIRDTLRSPFKGTGKPEPLKSIKELHEFLTVEGLEVISEPLEMRALYA